MSGSNTETERRFLVRVRGWSAAAADASREHLVQAYLTVELERTVRIRLAAGRAVLTVKGPPERGTRTEIECAIDEAAARAILDARLFVGTPVEKTRSTLKIGGLTWEVDQFESANAGLLLAEVELGVADDRTEWDARVDRERPPWLAREVTGDPRFSNSRLAVQPFATWPEAARDEVMNEIES